jgi:hypothetical protein
MTKVSIFLADDTRLARGLKALIGAHNDRCRRGGRRALMPGASAKLQPDVVVDVSMPGPPGKRPNGCNGNVRQ